MSKEQGLLNQIIKWLADSQRWIRGKPHETARDILERLLPFFTMVGNLDAMLARKEPILDFLDSGSFIYLKPVEKGGWMIPILSIRYNFRSAKPVTSLRLALFLLDEAGNLKARGYRFETPSSNEFDTASSNEEENPSSIGRHDYYHAQLIISFDKKTSRWSLPCEPWLPTSQPAFPLDAEDPITLIVCLLVSLYGLNYVSVDLSNTPFQDLLKPYVQKMTLHKFIPDA